MRIPPRHRLWIILIGLLASGTRLIGLTDVPPPIGQDEASNGYDGYCLWETGCDRWGHRLPVLLEGFGRGDNRPALYAYLVAPCAALVGPTRLLLATRLPAALLGTLTVFALYGLVRRLDRPATGLWAALLLAVSPWHLYLSRIGHEGSLTPAVVIIGLYFAARSNLLVRRIRPGSIRLQATPLIVAAVCMGLAPYTYASMRLFLPAMLLACACLYRRHLSALWRDRVARHSLIATGLLVAVFWAPMAWKAVTAWNEFAGRSIEQSIFHQGWPVPRSVLTMVRQYIAHFGWRWLFTSGDTSVVQSIPGMGQLAWMMLPFLGIGSVTLIRSWRQRVAYRLLAAWVLLHPVAASVAVSGAHALRSAVGIGVFAWIAAIGIREFLHWLGNKGQIIRTVMWTLVVFAILANGAHTVRCLVQASRSAPVQAAYQTDLWEAIQGIRDRWRDYDRVFVSDRWSQEHDWRARLSYIYVLLGLPVPPAEFQSWPRDISYVPETNAFHQVHKAGPFVFSTTAETLAEHFEAHPYDHVLIIGRPGDVRGGRVISRVLGPRGDVRFEVLEAGTPPATP